MTLASFLFKRNREMVRIEKSPRNYDAIPGGDDVACAFFKIGLTSKVGLTGGFIETVPVPSNSNEAITHRVILGKKLEIPDGAVIVRNPNANDSVSYDILDAVDTRKTTHLFVREQGIN